MKWIGYTFQCKCKCNKNIIAAFECAFKCSTFKCSLKCISICCKPSSHNYGDDALWKPHHVAISMYRNNTIVVSPKVTYIFKNQPSKNEQIVKKEWEKNIIENLGLNNNDICKKNLRLFTGR